MSLAPVADDDLADALRHRITGVVALAEDPDYQRIMPWNLAVPVAPCAAVFAASAQCRPPDTARCQIGPDSILGTTGSPAALSTR
jgi:hypothetical protein